MFETLEFTTTIGVLLVGLAICWLFAVRAKKERKKNAPPSLPHLPIVGSLPFLSGLSNLHVCLTEKCKKYGKIFCMYAGSRYIVILNGHELIREALIKNSSDYAGRGEIYIEKYVWPDHGRGLGLSPAGDAQRKMRSNCVAVLKNFGFGSRAVMEQRIQEEASHLILYIHSMAGKAWYPASILELTTMNVIYNLMFGKRFAHDDPQGQDLMIFCRKIVESVDPILDVFPILALLPYFQRRFAETLTIYENYMKFCESKVEESINDADSHGENFVNEYIKINGKESLDMRDMALIVRDLIIAGTETTSGQLNWALILLANHPDVQSRLQQEIDSVVPRDRLPSLDDKPGLSYLEAVILEVLRLKTAVPLSIPRLTLAETEIGGYNIPAGTEVLVNLWSAHMDPHVWDEPEKFNPSRFLDDSGKIVNRDLMITFSHGKRSCLGEILARQEMFLFLSAILKQFHILPPEGELKVKDTMCFIRSLVAVEHTIRFVARDLL